MPALVNNTPDAVYNSIQNLYPAWDTQIETELHDRVIAMSQTSIVDDVADSSNQAEVYGEIKSGMRNALRKHNSFRRDDMVALTLLNEVAIKVNAILMAGYDATEYDTAKTLVENAAIVMEVGVAK